MALHVLKRGLDIPIEGEATGSSVDLPMPATVAYCPMEFRGLKPRLAAREGDKVQAGDPLFYDKTHPEIRFLSPVAGVVKEIRRGRRRVITDFIVGVEGDGAASLPGFTMEQLQTLGRDQAAKCLAGGGLWGTLRTRPLDRLPAFGTVPQSIHISAMDTGPLQPGADVLLSADDADFMQAGVHVLAALTDGEVSLAVRQGSSHPALSSLQKVRHYQFEGPHPAGDPTVQINLVGPPLGRNEVWYLRAWDVVLIGKLFLEGRFPAQRTYAAVGTGVTKPRFVRTVLGAPLQDIAGGVAEGPARWIRGSVLTGEAVDPSRWAGWFARAVHVLPEGVQRHMWGWALPNLSTFSFHRMYLSGLLGSKTRHDLRPGLYGGVRTIIPVGYYGKVVATPDILPEFLFKSIIAGDLEESIKLGMLDLSMEEAALCTYVCPSKIEFDELLREGIELYEREA